MFKHNDKLMSRNTIFWSRQDYLEIDYLERDYLEGDYLEKDYLERGYLEKDYLERDYLGRDYLERDYLEKDYLESDSLRQIDRKLYLSTVTLIKNIALLFFPKAKQIITTMFFKIYIYTGLHQYIRYEYNKYQ